MKNLKFRMPIYYNGKFKEWHYWGFLNDDEFGFRFESPHSDYRNCPSDQFTGVYDDYGNEIYENDIVEAEVYAYVGDGDFQTYIKKILVVNYKWKDPYTQVPLLKFMGDDHKKELVFYNKGSRTKVIGNIYENKNILPKKIYEYAIKI